MSIALFGFLRSKLKKLQLATEKRLSPLEEQFHALARANINMEPTVEESATGGIATLPKNAADGPFSKFMLEGDTRINVAENILKGGNFHDMSAWEILNIDLSLVYSYDGILTLNFTGSEYNFYMSQNLAPKPGHRYYVQGEIQCVNCGIEINAGSQFRGVYDNQQYELISMISDSPTTLTFSISGFYDLNPKAYLRNWMVVDLGDESSPLYNKTEEELEALFPTYFDGTYTYAPIQHASGSYQIKSVGKNKCDVTVGSITRNGITCSVDSDGTITLNGTATQATSFKFTGGLAAATNLVDMKNNYKIPLQYGNNRLTVNVLSGSTSQVISFAVIGLSGNALNNGVAVGNTTGGYTFVNKLNDPASFVGVYINSGRTLNNYKIKLQIEEGSTATEYEPYSAQTIYVNCGELRRLPNGVCDEYDVLEGIKTERIGQKVYSSYNYTETSYSNVDLKRISTDSLMNLTGSISSAVAATKATAYSKNKRYEVFNAVPDDTQYIGKIYVDGGGIYAVVAKGADFTDFPITLEYQLAEPIITPYYPQTLTAKPSGTICCELVLGDADFYGQGIVLEGYAFVGIEKVTKIDLESGVEIDVTDTCTLNEAKNGFTSTALQAGDICWYELRIDPETTLIPEMEYAYYDSRYVVVDDSNGKYYRWKIASTDGVPRIELEEV